MIGFPGRRFTVGSPHPAHHAEPLHEVEIDSFQLADRCVSAADFLAFLRDAPLDLDHTQIDCIDPAFIVSRAAGFELRPGCDEFPMIQISYWGAAAYCNWLSRLEGLRPVYNLGARTAGLGRDGYRLPTEAEWEAACRDGRPDGTRPGPEECNAENAGPMCRALRAGETLAGNFLPGAPAPVPVASLSPDAAGLYQMLGNVREWCHDRFGSYVPGSGPLRNPTGASRGAFRVVRGGSFADPADTIGPASRMAAHEDTRCEVYGFRVVRRG
ncbi:formylglycine-generating enzyme family protein [Streptomyces coffeae]|uniref:SUMF1/EgtB/PvdO family nonheme iron enzyme n=1 Tax=Streptomyces coffeae TaxID=621382 RepID=A0ABS1NB21_9ACTN|nr:SUMF1/EgtB/PvdO family nonheme iron enzyme [Streptomyces coffeae]MBL1097272.1 SUMF1/EgtB/PvdO family nonheme iron enzyme [Streptomyces coffeae]